MAAPLLVTNLPTADYLAPILVLGFVQLVFMLPPVLNKKLPNSFDEADKLKDDIKSSCCTY